MSEEIDWAEEADKWRRLSRKNEVRARQNFAEVKLLRARLEIAGAARNPHLDIAALNRQVKKHQQELAFWTSVMQSEQWTNRHRGRVHARTVSKETP